MTDQDPHALPPSFSGALKAALDHFGDARWLGEQSPLSAPYFLGSALPPGATAAEARGQALQLALLGATAQLDPATATVTGRDALLAAVREGSREQRLVYWKYLHTPKQTVQFIIDQLNVARATFHRDVKDKLPEIVAQLGGHLLQAMRPSLRLEAPPAGPLVGRDELVAELEQGLAAAPLLQLVGPLGIGKTALAAELARRWAGPVFWLTLRPDLSDSLAGGVVLLGWFLHRHGASQLWSQVIADGDRINPQVAVGLALEDCAALAQPPLLCLDDCELLLDDTAPHRAGLRALLHTLAADRDCPARLLTLSDQPWAADLEHRTVGPLSAASSAAFVAAAGVTLGAADQAAVWEQTQGYPQTLKLLTLLLAGGEPLATLLDRAPAAPLMATFARRLRGTLSPAEQLIVEQLAVFRRPAPLAVAPAERPALLALVARQIVQRYGDETVALAPLLRAAWYGELDDERRRQLHRRAAALRAAGGQATAAAHHYAAAGVPALAVQAWFPEREQELRDGQGGAALRVFAALDPAALPAAEQQALALLLAELGKRTGTVGPGLAAFDAATWPRQTSLRTYAQQLSGDLLEAQGLPEAALQRYEAALQAVTGLLEQQQVHLHARIGHLHMARFQNLDAAWAEACQARYAAELFQGEVQDERGKYAEARVHYQTALAVAEQLSDPLRQARAHFNLAIIAARREESGLATFHFEQTMHWYAGLGDLVRTERTRTNLAAFYVQTGRYSEAIAAAEQALAFFTQVGFTNWMALNAVNLADAHAALGELTVAERYASTVLRAEESSYVPYALTVLAEVRRQQGEHGAAAELLRQAISASQASGDLFAAAPAWRKLGEVQAHLADDGAAQAAFDEALNIYTALGLPKEVARTAERRQAHAAPH